jgi:hypothetical protein
MLAKNVKDMPNVVEIEGARPDEYRSTEPSVH